MKPNESIIHIPHSPRYSILHQQRQQIISAYTNHDYDCDYLQVKGQGKSGTTWLKLVLNLIEGKLCQHTNYTQSYHYQHSKYSLCKDWTNGTADHTLHSSNFNRHAMHDIKNLLLQQQERKEENDSMQSKYFMGYGMYDLWRTKQLRYCVFMVWRDPRNRVISRINTYNKKLNNYSVVSKQEKNQLFKQRFTAQFVNEYQRWWRKYSLWERQNVMDYYLYFYEDIRMYQYQILKDMVWFAGYEQYIGDELIHEIMAESDINARATLPIVNTGNLCSFHSEHTLTEETKRYANQLMMEILSDELIERFNRTCSISL